ncbi:hypothetical protein BKA70DRAFT_1368249 [Coprinopsis sp. MPI-PUGE-AT-0042]|nr:hypothetical protein BKA70DRAFT_1368249 [Coprinopsis sp. MPI-PUGE-AT-0042]
MAFEIPSHLPRRALPEDVSSKILNRIDSAFVKDLDAKLADSWVSELDESIAATKTRIHDRIQEDLPNFRRQLDTSKSVQRRLGALTSEGDSLNEKISSSTGLFPATLQKLQAHSALAQKASDATAVAESLSHLVKCKRQHAHLASLLKEGNLPECVAAAAVLVHTCDDSPRALQKSRVLLDLKSKLQTVQSRVEEQLLDALSSIVVVEPSRLTVRTNVPVYDSDNTISLDAALGALASASLEQYLGNLRKHLTSYFIGNVLQQPFSIAEDTSMAEHGLNLTPASPNSEPKRARLDNLAHVLDFVRVHIFEKLPESQSTTFLKSLAKPVTNGILNLVLIPQLPSSFGLLPPFLDLVQQAVEFEEQYIVGLLHGGAQDRPVKAWAESLSNHYEKQRRNVILEKCRSLLKEPIDTSSTFFAVLEHPVDTHLPTAIQGDTVDTEDSAWGLEDSGVTTVPASAVVVDEDSWSFDDDDPASPRNFDSKEPMQSMQAFVIEDKAKDEDSWGLDDDTAEDNWGFDDDADAEGQNEVEEVNGDTETKEDGNQEPDSDDAWGWKDEKADETIVEDTPADDNAWDDPWGEPEPTEPKATPAKAPKVAKRLEKLASKGKKAANGNGTPVHSPPPPSSPPRPLPTSSTSTTITSKTRPRAATVKPAAIVTKVHPPVEQYRVTERSKRLVRMVEDAVAEGKQFAASNLFSKLATGSIPGATLFQTASSVIDLFQALYPVQHESPLEAVQGALQYANDCSYLSGALGDLEEEVGNQATVKERLAECKDHLNILSRSWFQDAIERECQRHDTVLSEGTDGFTYTTDQDRYDECEAAINKVVRGIKDISRRIKPILAKSKYYEALGRLVDAALTRILRDIVSLSDITEVESHRLSELCRIFNSIEGLFSEDPNQPSFVVAFVPSWLKFNYLSELLEASLADITYLFEEGALADFESDELVKLVRALFADTPLRTNTINKLLARSPTSP